MSYAEQMWEIIGQYRASDQSWPASCREIAEWAVRTGRWSASKSAEVDVCVKDLGRAMREERILDREGRSIRVMHARTVLDAAGRNRMLWDDLRTASHEHMSESFLQRRAQIALDCQRLATDVNGYNSIRVPAPEPPVQISFDFTSEVSGTKPA